MPCTHIYLFLYVLYVRETVKSYDEFPKQNEPLGNRMTSTQILLGWWEMIQYVFHRNFYSDYDIYYTIIVIYVQQTVIRGLLWPVIRLIRFIAVLSSFVLDLFFLFSRENWNYGHLSIPKVPYTREKDIAYLKLSQHSGK